MIIQYKNFGNVSKIHCGTHENHNFGSHIHQFSEFVFVLDGEMELTVDGKTKIGKKGDVFCITPFKVHSFRTPVYSKIHIFVFSNDFALGLITEDALYAGREGSLFTPSKPLWEYVQSRLAEATYRFHAQQSKDGYRSICACIHALLDEYFSQVPKGEQTKKDLVLSEILLYLSKHYKEPITMDDLSAALGYTKGHLSHCLAAIPYFNFNSLLNSLRIELAKQLLLTSNARAIDIALEVGFSCERSFHRAFKQLTGMTPRAYVDKKKTDATFENFAKLRKGTTSP